jgi:hypothetical protein
MLNIAPIRSADSVRLKVPVYVRPSTISPTFPQPLPVPDQQTPLLNTIRRPSDSVPIYTHSEILTNLKNQFQTEQRRKDEIHRHALLTAEQEKLEEVTSLATALDTAKRKHRDETIELREVIKQLQDQLEKEKNRVEKSTKELLEKESNRRLSNHQLNDLNQSLTEFAQLLDSEKTKRSIVETERDQLRFEMEQTKEQLATFSHKSDMELSSLRRENEKLTRELADLREDKNRQMQSLVATENDAQRIKADFFKRKNVYITISTNLFKQTKILQSELRSLRETVNSDVSYLSDWLSSGLSELKRHVEATLSRRNNRLGNLEGSWREDRKLLESRLSQEHADFERCFQRVRDADEKRADAERLLSACVEAMGLQVNLKQL